MPHLSENSRSMEDLLQAEQQETVNPSEGAAPWRGLRRVQGPVTDTRHYFIIKLAEARYTLWWRAKKKNTVCGIWAVDK